MKRPDGSGQLAGGWALLILGALVSLWGMIIDAGGYSGINAGDLVTKWMMLYAGGGLISAAFILFVAGWIIQAIAFLPGRNDAVPVTSQSALLSDEPALSDHAEPLPEETQGSAIWIIVACIGVAAALILYGVFTQQ